MSRTVSLIRGDNELARVPSRSARAGEPCRVALRLASPSPAPAAGWHTHRCPDCAATFRCTAACAAVPAYRCVCCTLDRIERSRVWTYEAYVHSPEWATRRRIALVTAGGRCQRCGARGALEVHHLHYRTLGREEEGDLEVLCKTCHPQADRERAYRTAAAQAEALYAARLRGWVAARYGEDAEWWVFAEEFDDWLQRREV